MSASTGERCYVCNPLTVHRVYIASRLPVNYAPYKPYNHYVGPRVTTRYFCRLNVLVLYVHTLYVEQRKISVELWTDLALPFNSYTGKLYGL
jgi:hypothetical protein